MINCEITNASLLSNKKEHLEKMFNFVLKLNAKPELNHYCFRLY